MALMNLYREAEDYFFKGICLKYLDINDTAKAYMTGIPISDLNIAYITKKTNDLQVILNQIQLFFKKRNLSFIIISPEELCTSNVESLLSKMSYMQTGKSSSMMIDLKNFITVESRFLDNEIVIKKNDLHLNEWMLPLLGAFESTMDNISMYADTHKLAIAKGTNLHHFSLYMKEKPVTSITLSIHNAIGRIDDVGTLPEFQGRGYATHLIIYALCEAQKLGVNYCFLESSISGLDIYQKIGFEQLFKNNVYCMKEGS